MKRLAVAVACALLLHAGMFWIGSGWFMSRTVPPSIPRPVTVTMSYRNAPISAAITHKEPVKPPNISAPDRPKAPARLPEKTALPREVRPEEKNAASRTPQEEATTPEKQPLLMTAAAAKPQKRGTATMRPLCARQCPCTKSIRLRSIPQPPGAGGRRARSYSACMWMSTAAFQTCGCLNQAGTGPLILRLSRRSKTGFLSPACRAAARLPCGSTCRSGLN